LPKVTKAQFYADGFSGKPDSGEKRKRLAKIMRAPSNISANALLELINKVYGAEEYEEMKERINQENL